MERNETFDTFKFLAMFGVVAIHTGTFQHTGEGEYLDFVVDAFFRFGVAYFFMVAGFFLMNKTSEAESPLDYVKKYLGKLGKILLTWSLFYFIYDMIRLYLLAEKKTLGAALTVWKGYFLEFFHWQTILYGASETHYHLWYLYALIWCAAILYIFIRFNLVKVLLLVSFVLNMIGLLGQSYNFFYELNIQTRDPFFFGLFYTALGAVGAKYKNSLQLKARKINTFTMVLLLFTFSALQVVEAYISYYNFGGKVGNYFIMTIPLVLFMLLLALRFPHLGRGTWFNKIGKNTLGIYVIHAFFISLLLTILTLGKWEELKDTVWWGLGFTPFIFLISYYASVLLQQVKKSLKARKRV
ncbi:acyltransferase [Thalassobacillus pellis]|uniref:acyltransferase n=1 Tax=Thalassobacillus pellis TaxID=748008 RepID=UPI00195FE5A3|nr:acyltransferase [Thalassobacillus pellis]MBM7551700.1 surface polysaccharide O-acyltransferase-like enzyme [Thalassobacillus pellis]